MTSAVLGTSRGTDGVGARGSAFAAWLVRHRGSVGLAALLSIGVPLTLFSGSVGVMRDPSAPAIAAAACWFGLYAAVSWALLLFFGCLEERFAAGTPRVRLAVRLVFAAAAALGPTVATAGRIDLLVAQGVSIGPAIAHPYAFLSSLIVAWMFFAHLQGSRTQLAAAARLAAAQVAQREARRRLVEARLKAVQARIDPQLLFEMLAAVRDSYVADAGRAERLLDELVAFLRAALPRLRTRSSTLGCEVELAHGYARLRAQARGDGTALQSEMGAPLAGAAFPPGVLMPLLDSALRVQPGSCTLVAARSDGVLRIARCLPTPPVDTAVARVRARLDELYAGSAALAVAAAGDTVNVTIDLPQEDA